MEANRFVGRPLCTTLTAVVVATLVTLLVSLQSGTPALAAEEPEFGGQVVGGTAVPNGKYPFMVALLDTRYGSSAFQQQFCGGTLIDRDSVLTAAHCLYGGTPRKNLRVAVGKTALSSSQGQMRRVSRIYLHPRYNGNASNAYDAAVLKLSRPVGGIKPIKLAGKRQNFLERSGRRAIVAGWGNMVAQPADGSAGSKWPNRMREARVPIKPDTYARSVYGRSYIPRLMVAAGETGKDSCQGDSGGPMFSKVNGVYRQIGITSFGAGCGAAGYPGVYAEVNSAPIRGFIVNRANR